MNGNSYVRYVHHEPSKPVFVREDLMGKHREHCLCYAPCVRFKPGTPFNCPLAQALYEFDVAQNMVTPVWECPDFIFGAEED